MEQQKIKPSRWYYGVAALVFACGAALFVAFLLSGLRGMSNELTQVLAPGTVNLNLTEPGSYTIFLERESVMDGKVYTAGDVSGLRCLLVNTQTQAEIPLSEPSISSTYSFGGRSGVGVLEFKLDQPGTYELTARYPAGQTGPQVVLAVGHDFVGKLLKMILGSLAILGGAGLGSLAIALLTFLKRRKAKKLLTATPEATGRVGV